MSVVLASVSPIAVKLAARDIERLGRTAGRLFAISTAGLDRRDLRDVVLARARVRHRPGARRRRRSSSSSRPRPSRCSSGSGCRAPALVAAAGAALLAVGALAPGDDRQRAGGLGGRNWSPLYREREVRTPRKLDPAEVGLGGEGFTVREARDTRYHRLLVVEDGTSRYLRFDSSFQSGMYLKRPFATRFSYSDYLQLGLAYNPSAKKILVIGLGGAAVQKRLWRDFRDVEVTTVELDPDVVDVAYRWFHLPRDPRLPVVVDDGRRFLQRTDERFDVIMVDAFYSDGVPFHMTTLEFAQLMRDRLTPGGVVATNVIGALTGGSSEITRALWKTYAAVFPTVELHPVYEGPGDRYPGDIRNIILVGTERAAPSPARLAESWEETRAARAPTAPDLRAAARGRWEQRRRDGRRAAPHRRLRADRRAPHRLSRARTLTAPRARARRRGSQAARRGVGAGVLERDVDDLGPAQRDHPPERARGGEVGRRDAEPRPEHPVGGARRAAALDVAEHGHPGLEPRQLLQPCRDHRRHAAEPLEPERVELAPPPARRAGASTPSATTTTE